MAMREVNVVWDDILDEAKSVIGMKEDMRKRLLVEQDAVTKRLEAIRRALAALPETQHLGPVSR